ncbi:MAG: hypothetical protein HY675_16220 [Chloroflexi bacterium]|nr:hypothetical protein [Chloroflexota bacterium]
MRNSLSDSPRRCLSGGPARAERGQAMVTLGLMMLVLVATAGLVVDAGQLFVERRLAQTVVDAATQAAAADLANGQTAARNTALYYAAQNGYNNDGLTNSVIVDVPPSSGSRSGDANFVQVTITRTVTTGLIQLVYSGAPRVSAAAVAGIANLPASDAVIILNRTACGAMSVSGTGSLSVTGAGATVNSNCSDALSVSGDVDVVVSKLDITGGYRLIGNATISPTPQTGVPPKLDPLRNLSAPDWSGMAIRSGTPTDPVLLDINGSQVLTLQPGIYYGGIAVRNTAQVTLEPGIYILAGGGFAVRNQALVSGNGVFFYNTQDPSHPTGAGSYGQFVLDGSGSVTLSPPTSGTYAKLLLFQDRANTQPFQLGSSAQLNSLGGTIYLPSANASLGGTGSTTVQLIADTLSIGGTGSINISYDGNAFMPAPTVTLVE